MTLAEVIRRARDRKGLTQEQLAEQLGVSRGYIGQLETGLVRRPRNEMLGKLSAALDVTREELARAAGIIEPAYDEDTRAALLRIRLLETPEQRIAALEALDFELASLVGDLAGDYLTVSRPDRARQSPAPAVENSGH